MVVTKMPVKPLFIRCVLEKGLETLLSDIGGEFQRVNLRKCRSVECGPFYIVGVDGYFFKGIQGIQKGYIQEI